MDGPDACVSARPKQPDGPDFAAKEPLMDTQYKDNVEAAIAANDNGYTVREITRVAWLINFEAVATAGNDEDALIVPCAG